MVIGLMGTDLITAATGVPSDYLSRGLNRWVSGDLPSSCREWCHPTYPYESPLSASTCDVVCTRGLLLC